MDANVWRDYFTKWPSDLDRSGVVVTAFDEQIPFSGFATSESLLLVERRTPDTIGARKLLVPYEQIVAVKIIDVVKMKAFESLGFVESVRSEVPRPKKPPG